MSALGLALDDAIRLFESKGYKVVCSEIRSKKGVTDGADKRVIRVREDGPSRTVYLAYSVFKTSINSEA